MFKTIYISRLNEMLKLNVFSGSNFGDDLYFFMYENYFLQCVIYKSKTEGQE